MKTDTSHDQGSDDRIDPGRPTVRLSGAEKQIQLAIERLQAESEHVDPDVIREAEKALRQVRDVHELVEADRWRREER